MAGIPKILCAALVAVCAATASRAADGANCQGAAEASNDLRLARVLGVGKRVNFVASESDGARTRDCPSENAVCRRNAFVVSGDVVVVDDANGGFACATYVSPRGVVTGGWLPANALDIKPAPAPKPGDWAGTWKRVEATITLKLRGGEIAAEGEATWGARDPRRVQNGGVHIGNFDGKAKPRGNRLAFGDGYDGSAPPDRNDPTDCRVLLRLVGPYLVAADNQGCGGANVSFDGVYTKAGG